MDVLGIVSKVLSCFLVTLGGFGSVWVVATWYMGRVWDETGTGLLHSVRLSLLGVVVVRLVAVVVNEARLAVEGLMIHRAAAAGAVTGSVGRAGMVSE